MPQDICFCKSKADNKGMKTVAIIGASNKFYTWKLIKKYNRITFSGSIVNKYNLIINTSGAIDYRANTIACKINCIVINNNDRYFAHMYNKTTPVLVLGKVFSKIRKDFVLK